MPVPVRVLLAALLLMTWPCPPAAAADGWDWPLAGEPAVVRGFDPPAERWLAGHRGVDLRGSLGEEVLAAGGGVVTFAGSLAGRGVVVVRHRGGLRTTYEPIEPSVRVGALVAAGDVLGNLDAGHGRCGLGSACLHWGLRRGATYLDPLSLVGRGGLRLLPLVDAGPAALPAPAPRDRDGTRDGARERRTSRSAPATAAAGLALVSGLLVAGAGLRRRAGTPG